MEGELTWKVAGFLSDVCVYGDTRVLFNIHCLWKKELLSIMTLGNLLVFLLVLSNRISGQRDELCI